ncbi:hypothetical protein Mal15_35770 [Stieleria maiorica]|uniref:Cna protein B-type domain protein n=1 Tax=Stieleria maiorica TaxID=2795974 RepID=A0A5B9ME18_9BACT|nr:hypothetical protein [Stieleria maiorica]QEF99512.1 hypothetical protein Mal15_35770 [Stieleria maiorica]
MRTFSLSLSSVRSNLTPAILVLATLVLTDAVASAEGDGQHLVVQQWVAADAEGRLDAVIVAPDVEADSLPAGSIRIALVSQEGAIYRAQPSAESNFKYSFVGVPDGVYTLVTRGPNLVACYAVHVVAAGDQKIEARHHQMEIAAASLRVNKVRNSVIRYMPSTIPFVAEFDGSHGAKMMTELRADHTYRVAQTASGMAGRIYRAGAADAQLNGAAGTNVLLYQNRELIGQAITEVDGSFSIDSLPPGFYSVIAIGPDGIGVLGFQLVEDVLASSEPAGDGRRLVAVQEPMFQPQFELQLAPSGLESPAIEELIEDEPQQAELVPPGEPGLPVEAASMEGAPVGGGGAGGGGAGGGVGGRGSLVPVLGFAAAGAAFAASSSDDDDAFSTPPVTSPITP